MNFFWVLGKNRFNALLFRFMGIDYYFVRAQYDWPEIADNPTYPVTWLSQFYSIIDIPQVLFDIMALKMEFPEITIMTQCL